MARTLFGGFEALDLFVLPDETSALARLRLHRDDVQDMATLRRMLDEDLGVRGVDAMTDDEVLQEVARQMSRGRIAGAGYTTDFQAVRGIRTGKSAWREGAAAAAAAAGAAAASAAAGEEPPPAEEETTWVEIELVDEKGEPVGGEEYWVRTSSGKALTGRLGSDGRARVRGVEPGTCEVTFPNLNATDWAAA